MIFTHCCMINIHNGNKTKFFKYFILSQAILVQLQSLKFLPMVIIFHVKNWQFISTPFKK
jgi:hypothetical protein